MVNDNVVSVKLTAKEISDALQKLKEIQSQLKDRLIALQPEQKRMIPKMSDKTLPFVEKVIDYVDSRPEFVPFYLPVEELKTDFKAVNDLRLILREAEQLCQALSDTILLSGSEAYAEALAYYQAVKQAAKRNIPDAKSVYQDLRKRFEQKSSGESSE